MTASERVAGSGPRAWLAVPAIWLRPAVYGLFSFQVYRGVRQPLDAFSESYWLVNYSHGFIRRGLTGSVLDALVGRPTPFWVEGAALVLALLALAGLLILIEALLRRSTRSSLSLALLLAVSPMSVSFLASQRRPDEIGVVLLLLLGWLLNRNRRRSPAVCAGIGLAFGALVLVHEGVILEYLPFAVVLAVALGPGAVTNRMEAKGLDRNDVAGIAWLVGPSLLAVLMVVAFGRVSPATAELLRSHEAFRPSGPTNGFTMFDFLSQSLHGAVSFVLHGPKKAHAAMLLLGGVLLILHAVWLRLWGGLRPWRTVAIHSARLTAAALTTLVVAASAALFLTGIDWLRWFCALTLAGMITVAYLVLPKGDKPTSVEVRISPIMAVVGLYLVSIPPLPTSAAAQTCLRLLFTHG